MNLEEIQKTMKYLRDHDDRPIFHSERDFVFAFARSLSKNFDLDIRMETKPYRDKKLFLDIWCPKLNIAFEIKYKTKPIELNYSNAYFKLGNHPTDLGRYDFIKDIKRLEGLVGDNKAKTGFAIILSNDYLYWKTPKTSKATNSDAFRIHKNLKLCKNTKMSWRDGSAELRKNSERSESIVLRHSYRLNWNHFSMPDRKKNGEFMYLIVPVGDTRRTAQSEV